MPGSSSAPELPDPTADPNEIVEVAEPAIPAVEPGVSCEHLCEDGNDENEGGEEEAPAPQLVTMKSRM